MYFIFDKHLGSMNFMKKIYARCTAQWITLLYAFLMAITCSIIRLVFRYFMPSPPGFLLEKNSVIVEQNFAPLWYNFKDVVCWHHAKQGTAAALTTKPKPKEEAPQKIWPYHVPLGTLVTHNLSSKWAKNEEVIHRLGAEDKLRTAFLGTLDSLPPQKQMQEQNSRVTYKDYLATTFTWSHIINQHIKFVIQEIQQYKELMAAFGEQKHISYPSCIPTWLLWWIVHP